MFFQRFSLFYCLKAALYRRLSYNKSHWDHGEEITGGNGRFDISANEDILKKVKNFKQTY